MSGPKQPNLDDYRFADAASGVNAHYALACVKAGLRGAFLVSGPPGSGKSHLVRSILSSRFGPPRESLAPASKEDMQRTLTRALLANPGYVWLDLARAVDDDDLALAFFITSPVWHYRPLRSSTVLTIANGAVLFICGGDDEIRVGSSMERRVFQIRLKEGVAQPLPTPARPPTN